MKYSLMLPAVLALGLALLPQAAPAQTDQTTAGPMATATVNPGATDQGMGAATATPGVDNSTSTTTTTTSSNTGWWGLVGLIGLLGLFGGRSNRRTTISGPP